MTSEQRDPREAVLLEMQDRIAATFLGLGRDDPPTPTETLEALDAADPLRAILPEAVDALEWIQALTGHMDSTEEEVTEAWKLSKALLTKLRALTATEGGTDDGE